MLLNIFSGVANLISNKVESEKSFDQEVREQSSKILGFSNSKEMEDIYGRDIYTKVMDSLLSVH